LMRFGFSGVNMSGRVADFRDVVELAKFCDGLGFDFYGFTDQFRDVFTVASVCALNTKRLAVGPMASTPWHRHPATLARGVATIDEVSGGRANLTLCRGNPHMGPRQFGYDTSRAPETIREAVVLIKEFLKGNPVDFHGQFFNVDRIPIGVKCRENIPIYIAAEGTRMLEAAGEVADGVVTLNTDEELFKKTVDIIKAAANRSGRSLDNFEIIVQPVLQVARTQEELREARNNVRSHVGLHVSRFSDEWMERRGISLESIRRLREFHKRHDSLRHAHYVVQQDDQYSREGQDVVTEEMFQVFSIIGDEDYVIDRLEALQRLGATGVSVWTIPWVMDEKKRAIKAFADGVLPHFKQEN